MLINVHTESNESSSDEEEVEWFEVQRLLDEAVVDGVVLESLYCQMSPV
jgi:hypothetical protein